MLVKFNKSYRLLRVLHELFQAQYKGRHDLFEHLAFLARLKMTMPLQRYRSEVQFPRQMWIDYHVHLKQTYTFCYLRDFYFFCCRTINVAYFMKLLILSIITEYIKCVIIGCNCTRPCANTWHLCSCFPLRQGQYLVLPSISIPRSKLNWYFIVTPSRFRLTNFSVS